MSNPNGSGILRDVRYPRRRERPDDVREAARRGRVLTVAEAIGYGLIHERATRRPS